MPHPLPGSYRSDGQDSENFYFLLQNTPFSVIVCVNVFTHEGAKRREKLHMRTYTTSQLGRIVLIHLGKGEGVLESVEAEVSRLGIKNGILLSAIGSLRKACLHFITNTDDTAVNRFITIERPIELSSAQGLIIDGVPHFHLTISEPDGMYAGHMEPCCEVQYLAELAILELRGISLTRRQDEYGISYIDTV